ncbi:MAG: hypothetical protein LBH28_10980 [Oscillospiraceae bacterium]|nr:hypothetical protein [Oscillospiraceae bacterium]
MRAYISAKAMKKHLDVVIRVLVEQALKQDIDPAVKEQLQSLADKYSGFRKNKDVLKKIPLANSIVSLYYSLEIGSAHLDSAGVRDEIKSELNNVRLLEGEYNYCAEALNKQLSKRFISNAGKLFRMKKLEELCDLSKILFDA